MSPIGGLFSFLGGFLVNYFGGAMTGTLSLFIAGVMTLLHPIALYTDFRLFLTCRFITGIFEVKIILQYFNKYFIYRSKHIFQQFQHEYWLSEDKNKIRRIFKRGKGMICHQGHQV